MHPVGAIVLVILLFFVSLGTRRGALVAMLAGVLYLTQGQSIEVLGTTLYAVRILGLALFVRVVVRREFSFSKLTPIDRALLILYAYTTVIFLLRSSDGQAAAVATAFDALFCYFGFRGLLKGEEDFRWLLRILILLLVPYVFLLGIERKTGHNPFAFMGGILQGVFIRDGVSRCMGAFRYPVSLGTFAATFLALYIGMLHSKADRRSACLAIIICLWIVWASNSGGSFSAACVAPVAWMFWKARKQMRLVRWAIVGLFVALSFAMKAPIWYLLDRTSFGGSSWHRAYLIDVAFRNLGKWWFAGMPLSETADWFFYTVNEGADITNQYLVFGISAGVGSVALLILLLVRVFGQIGKAMAKLEFGAHGTRTTAFMMWGLGAMTTVHAVNWLGVSYFDQIYVIWMLHFAAVASLTDQVLKRADPSESKEYDETESSIATGFAEPAMAANRTVLHGPSPVRFCLSNSIL